MLYPVELRARTNVLVELEGLEPSRCFHHRILSPMRLPIPPQLQFLEVRIRFELMITELQSIALPLG